MFLLPSFCFSKTSNPLGWIEVKFELIDKETHISIKLPKGLSCNLIWQDQRFELLKM